MTKARTIIVGDIHGCWDELQKLLEKVDFDAGVDRFISLGDMVDRGPNPREVVDFCMQHEAVLGNHDERQLRYREEWQRIGAPTNPEIISSAIKWKADYHRETFLVLEERHFEWFKTLPRFLRLPDLGPDGNPISLMHAGCIPQVPLEEQTDFILMHVSDIKPPETGYDETGRLRHGYWRADQKSWWTSKRPPGADFWANLYDGSNGFVVFGHTGFKGVAHFRHALGIDTGCCFGRELTALVLPDWELVSVPASKGYRRSGRTKEYEIAPGIVLYS